MEISRSEILSKTHYGITIYAYILRQYFNLDTVLSVSGKDCHPAPNPFNSGKKTLVVRISEGCARHIDTDRAIASGTVFDFASLHFDLSGRELDEKINEELNLRIDQKNPFYHHTYQGQQASPQLTLAPIHKFSYFSKPITNIVPTKEATLVEVYLLIKGDSFKQATEQLRTLQDVRLSRKFKASSFDYVTFSGLFSKRSDSHLKKHSGLLTIDFDLISDIPSLKKILHNDHFFETELLFVSPSGKGLKWIISIELFDVKHQNYFKAVANYLRLTYKIEVDQSGKDISRACFLSHDPEVYINPKHLQITNSIAI